MEQFTQAQKALLEDFFREAFPNPERRGCPSGAALKAYAEDAPLDEPSVLSHISSCSECYTEYAHYRADWKESLA